MPLGSVYREEGKPLNWSIHSGTAGPWSNTDIGELHASLGTAFGRCGDFGLLCTMALLNEYTPADLAMQVYTDFRTVDKKEAISTKRWGN
jgi:hypothetical protein